MGVFEGSARSSGPTKFPTTICTRRLGAQVPILRSRNAGLVGWDMYILRKPPERIPKVALTIVDINRLKKKGKTKNHLEKLKLDS